MLRRASVWVLFLSLGLVGGGALGGCAPSEDQGRGSGPEDRELRQAPEAKVPLVLHYAGEQTIPRHARIVVYGYEGIEEDGWTPGAKDRIAELWWTEPEVWNFPLQVSASVAGSNRLLVLLDRGGDVYPSAGDLSAGVVQRGLSAGQPEPVELWLEETSDDYSWLWDAIASMDTRSEDEGGSRGPQPGEEAVRRRLELSRDYGVPRDLDGLVFVVGYEPGLLDGGLPLPDDRPLSFWSGGKRPQGWPSALDAKLPVGLDLLVFVDTDQSFNLSPGDWVAEPLPLFRPPPEGEVVRLRLIRPIPAAGDWSSGADGAAGSGAAGVPLPPASALPGPVSPRALQLRSKVPLSLLSETHLLVLGFGTELSRASERILDTKATFRWLSQGSIEGLDRVLMAPLAESQSLYVVLDLNGDGRPSPDEPMGGPAGPLGPADRDSRAPLVITIDRVVADPDD